MGRTHFLVPSCGRRPRSEEIFPGWGPSHTLAAICSPAVLYFSESGDLVAAGAVLVNPHPICRKLEESPKGRFLMGEFSPIHWMIVLAVIVLLFGGRRIPEVMRGLGEGIRSFKEGMKGDAPGTSPATTAPPVSAPPPSSSATDNKVTH
jgi:sec-independent protein translocase protein TatA